MGLSADPVTAAQASALLADWHAMVSEPGLQAGIWADIQALFLQQRLPELMAARFLVLQSKQLADRRAMSARDQFSALQVCTCLGGG
jgi:hypothetical protein